MILAKLGVTLAFVVALVLGAGTLIYSAGGQTGATGQPPKEVAGTITGRVVHAADGKPVSGADVRLLRRGTYAGTPPTRKTTANAQGEFIFDAVAPGDYRVWAFHGNLASRSRMYEGDIANVAADGVDDLPPGTYEVQIYGPAVRQPNNPGAFETPVIGRRAVALDEGKQEMIELGSGEIVQNQRNL